MAATLGRTCILCMCTLRVNSLRLRLATLDRLLPYPHARTVSPFSQHTSSVTMQMRFQGVWIPSHISLGRNTSTTTAHPCSRKSLKHIIMLVLAERTPVNTASPLRGAQARNRNICRCRFSHSHLEVRRLEARHMARRHTYMISLMRALYKCTSVIA